MTRLTDHFTLEELTWSLTASRRKLANTPPPQAIANLTHLAIFILEPLRSHMGCAVNITSGYRSQDLNRLIGGTPHSQHCLGLAADIVFLNPLQLEKARRYIQENLTYDQLILEHRGNDRQWLHVSYLPTGSNRHESLISKKESYYDPDF